MAIDPTTPLTPIIPTPQAGTAPDSVAALQAMARAALINTTNELGQIVGRPGAAPAKTNGPVEQAGQTSTQDAGHAADTASSAKSASVVHSAAQPKAQAETRIARAVRTAAAEAVPRQSGLAPLMASVRAVVDRADMPAEVREAGRALLARTPPAAEIMTPRGLRQAVERSGVFLEARMARAAVAPSPQTAPRLNEGQDLKAALLVFRGALSSWLAKASPQVLDIDSDGDPPPSGGPEGDGGPPAIRPEYSPQGRQPAPSAAMPRSAPESSRPDTTPGLSKTLASSTREGEVAMQIATTTPAPPSASPASVAPVGQEVFPSPAEAAVDATSPPEDVSSENAPSQPQRQLASAEAPARSAPTGGASVLSPPPRSVAIDSPAAPPAPPGSGAETPKAVPTADQANEPPPSLPKPPAAAPAAPEDDAIAARFASFVAAPKALPQATPVRAALSALVQLGLMAEEAVREDAPASTPAPAEAKPLATKGYSAAFTEAARPKVPPPPYAGGPMAGQKPVIPAATENVSTPEVVRGLLKAASGALARQDLMQIASLPETLHHHDVEPVEARPQGARLNLDLPFMTPQGVAVAQFEISHDGGGTAGGAVGPAERTYKARFSIDLEPLGPVHALVTLTGARTRVSLWAERAETIARLRAGEESLGAALRQAELTPEVAVHSGAPPTRGGGPLGHFVDQAS